MCLLETLELMLKFMTGTYEKICLQSSKETDRQTDRQTYIQTIDLDNLKCISQDYTIYKYITRLPVLKRKRQSTRNG